MADSGLVCRMDMIRNEEYSALKLMFLYIYYITYYLFYCISILAMPQFFLSYKKKWATIWENQQNAMYAQWRFRSACASAALREIVHLNLSPGYMESPGTDQSEFFFGIQIFGLYSV